MKILQKFIIIKPTIKILTPVYASRCHTLHCYFKPGAGVLKWQDKQLPDPSGPLSSIIPAEIIRDTNNAHTITTD